MKKFTFKTTNPTGRPHKLQRATYYELIIPKMKAK